QLVGQVRAQQALNLARIAPQHPHQPPGHPRQLLRPAQLRRRAVQSTPRTWHLTSTDPSIGAYSAVGLSTSSSTASTPTRCAPSTDQCWQPSAYRIWQSTSPPKAEISPMARPTPAG